MADEHDDDTEKSEDPTQRRLDEAAKRGDLRRSQVGGGGRSEKIRTYNFRENRVTDHRVNLTLHKLDQVLAGDLDDLTDALMSDKRARQLAGPDDAGGMTR